MQQVPIIEHADVRRMLLRQKSIVEGALSLLASCGRYADLAEHAAEPAERRRAARLLDLLTPVAKTFPAERGFESNALAVQVHGGYGYTSEYLPEAWLRDQKLNSLHEGTSGIQSLDLLGRKVVAEHGAAMIDFAAEIEAALVRAERAGVPTAWREALSRAVHTTTEVTVALAARGASGDREGMLRGAADFMDLFSTLVIAWQWMTLAAAAEEGLAAGRPGPAFYRGKRRAAQYFFANELPRVEHLAARLLAGDDAFAAVTPDEL